MVFLFASSLSLLLLRLSGSGNSKERKGTQGIDSTRNGKGWEVMDRGK